MAALSVGARLGPYEVAGLIGAGGMGEVYRACDTRLGRAVAIKVLSRDLAGNAARESRFEREARTISALNHPHICTLYDVGESDGQTFLVMEHLAGETLAERLRRGQLSLEQALTLATEIADALAAAHRQGIIHRDLKPGNVMLTKTGAKLLDFGLAKLIGHDEQGPSGRAPKTTWTMPLTGEKVIVGTLQYMAPEQVEGKPADARTDLWALGATIYEMVSGRPAFEGANGSSLIGAILEREPARLSTLQPLTPPALEWLVRRCLAKAPDDRPDSAHDVASDLRWLRETSGAQALTGARLRRRRRLQIALAAAGALTMTALGAGVTWLLRPSPPPASIANLHLDLRPAEALGSDAVVGGYMLTRAGSRTAMAWTPDGQALVFVGRRSGAQRVYGGAQQLYVRRLDAPEARPLPHTEGAHAPVVSLDGQWVAFWARRAIRKVPIGGGPVVELLANIDFPPWGLAWDARGRLFFGGEGRAIGVIPPEGAPAAVTRREVGSSHGSPFLLPGGHVLLYTVKRFWTWGEEEVVAQRLDTGVRKVLLRDAADARYVPTGHLVFLRRGALFAVPFDAKRLELRGAQVLLLDPVAQALVAGHREDHSGAGQVAISSTGTLAWVPGPVSSFPDSVLVTVDRRGRVSPLPAPARAYGPMIRVSPDGHRLAMCIKTPTETNLWLYDIARGALSPRNREGQSDWPVWSPDGRQLVFQWFSGDRLSLAVQPADGTAAPRRIVTGALWPSAWTPDGRAVVAALADGPELDIVTVTNLKGGTASVQPFMQTSHREGWPEPSPDGRWLAYTSNVSGRDEVYVRPYPGPGPSEPVSIDGGTNPIWHPNGKELYFVSRGDQFPQIQMMQVDFEPGPPPRIDRPRRLFAFNGDDAILNCTPIRCHDIAPDGQRFYAVQTPTPPVPPVVTEINLIQNWVEELRIKVPAH